MATTGRSRTFQLHIFSKVSPAFLRERNGSSLASARTVDMPLACATSAAEPEHSSATACHPCAVSTLVLPPPAPPAALPEADDFGVAGPGGKRTRRGGAWSGPAAAAG